MMVRERNTYNSCKEKGEKGGNFKKPHKHNVCGVTYFVYIGLLIVWRTEAHDVLP